MTAYRKGKDLLQGWGLGIKININTRQNTHITTRETTQHYIKRDLRQQHSKAATHDNTVW
jgi:hypothetical protein